MKNMKKATQKTADESLSGAEATTAPQTVPAEEKAPQSEERKESGQEPHPSPEISSESSSKPEEPAQTEDENSLQRQLEEAEQRGYLRGRNERIQQLMQEPAPLERPSASFPSGSGADTDQASPMILNNPRVSIWDR